MAATISATDDQLVKLWDKIEARSAYGSIAYQLPSGRWLYLCHNRDFLEIYLMQRPPRVQAGASPTTWLDYREIPHRRSVTPCPHTSP